MVNRSILAVRVGRIISSPLSSLDAFVSDVEAEIIRRTTTASSRPTSVSSAPARPSAGPSYGASSPIFSRAVKDRLSDQVIPNQSSEVGLIRPPASTIQVMSPTNTWSLVKEAHPTSWSRVLVLDLAATRPWHRQVKKATLGKLKPLPSISTKARTTRIRV